MESEKALELVYESPRKNRIFAAHFFDWFVTILIGFCFLLGSNQILKITQSYQNETMLRDSIRKESKLYEEKEGTLYPLNSYLDDSKYTREAKCEFYETRLTYFYETYLAAYPSSNGKEAYSKLKTEAKSNGTTLFNVGGTKAQTSSDYLDAYVSFYESSYSNDALGRLNYNPSYHKSLQSILGMQIASFAVSFSLSGLIFFLVIPLCIKRGRLTLGMKLSRIGLVDSKGLSPKISRSILYCLFRVIFIYIGSIVAFLVPLAISIGFFLIRKNNQTLEEYLFGLYQVDTKNERIYSSIFEAKRLQKSKY